MARPLRICFVAYRGNMRCGGQGVYLWFLARELAKLGHEVDVFVGPPYPDPMPFAKYIEQLPNEQFWGTLFSNKPGAFLPRGNPFRIFEPLNFYEFAATRFGFLPEPFAFSLRAYARIAKHLQRGKRYDIVHDVQCLGYGLLGLQALGIPVVTTIHHPLTVDRRASFRRDKTFEEALGTLTFYPVEMQRFVARRVKRIITSSMASARTIARDFGVAEERLAMLWNGLDTEIFRPDPTVQRSANEILCVGRASDPNKGIVDLVEALAQIESPARLTLIDEDHAENPARKRAQALGILDRIDFVGRVPLEELVRLYNRATLVAVPSLYEGFGLPAVEAMACGTAVVATRAGALAEVVTKSGGGILVPPHNPVELARGIKTLLANPTKRADLSQRGRAGVEATFAWPKIAESTVETYREVIAKQRKR